MTMALSYELSWASLQPHVPGLFVALVCYVVGLAVYRLYLSPLAKFPGPKLAGMYPMPPGRKETIGCLVLTNRRLITALTTWYAGYHDLIRGGQYVFVVEEMHRKYGMWPSCLDVF